METGYDIIVLAGQSNAMGCGHGAARTAYRPDERILWVDDDAEPHRPAGSTKLEMHTPATSRVTVAREREENGLVYGNLALSFAARYLESGRLAAGRRILIVASAVGATGFSSGEWGVGNVLYERLCTLTDFALGQGAGENRLVAFLWHQGEGDSFIGAGETADDAQARYYGNLSRMLVDYTERYGAYLPSDGCLPFVAAGFCHDWYVTNRVGCDPILAATRALCADVLPAGGAVIRGAYVETDDLPSNHQATGNADGIHFCRESLYTLGTRYFTAYERILQA